MGTIGFQGTLDKDEIYRSLALSQLIYGDNISKYDLSRVKFVDPYGMVLLIQMIEQRLDTLEEVIMPASKRPFKYMARAGFFDQVKRYLTLTPEEELVNEEVRRNPANKTLIDITRIENNKDIKETIKLVLDQNQNILTNELNYKENDIYDYSGMLVEILSNIPRHSKSHGYVCAQSYHYAKSSNKYVSVCISDVGIGIRKSFDGLYGKINDLNALQLAVIEEKSSIEIRGGRGGNGYKGIKEKVEKLGGSIFVKSGTGEIGIDKEQILRLNDVPFFPGTQIQIFLPEKRC